MPDGAVNWLVKSIPSKDVLNGNGIILEQQIQRCSVFTPLLHGKDGGALVHRQIFKDFGEGEDWAPSWG